MTYEFDPTATHDPHRDVRDWTFLARKIQSPANGCLHLLVAPRRAGKTWALRALEATTSGKYLLLQAGNEDDWFRNEYAESPVLLDEAGHQIHSEPYAFLRRCRQRHEGGRTVLAAVTPREYAALSLADPKNRFLHDRDVHDIPTLGEEECMKLAGGVDWALEFVRTLPDVWKRSAFLLACALQAAEQSEKLRTDMNRATQRAIEIAKNLDYIRSVVYEGLSQSQRNALRTCAGHRSARNAVDMRVLERCGLVSSESHPRILDPVIADHFREPIIIHHISDVHIGPKAARVVDQKDGSSIRDILTKAGGEQWLRDEYVSHVGSAAKPHIIALTGDLVEKGGDESMLDAASEWLSRLHTAVKSNSHPDLGDSDPRIMVVGGNHDVDWDATTTDQPATKRHEPFASRFESYPHPRLHKPAGDRGSPFVHLRGCRLSFLLLGSAEFGGQLDYHGVRTGSEQWVNYLLELLEGSDDEESKTRLTMVLTELGVDLEKIGTKLKVQRVDPGLVAKSSLDRSQAESGDTEPFRIALLHHPLSPLPAAPEIARYAGLINAGQVKDALFALEVQLVLHGHQHRAFYAEEKWPPQYKEPLRILAASSLGSRERDESNGYNEIKIFREGDVLIAVEARMFRFQGSQWKCEAPVVRFLLPGMKAEEWRIDHVAEERP